MTQRLFSILTVASSLLSVLACSAEADPTRDRNASGAGNGTPGSGGSGAGGSTGINVPTHDPSDTREVPIRKKVCDAAGKCTCLRLALLGTLDSAAFNKDTQPFIDWLNANSGGTATVTMVSAKPNLDATFLGQYDVLLVANVNAWSFSAGEKAAVETWVRETGGGIITLTGFQSVEAEIAATSQLIEFSGIRYQAPKAAENGQPKPVYYKGGSVDLKNCLAWSQSIEAIITTPIKFVPQTGSLSKLTYGLDYVGAFIGWGVSAPPGSTVVATDPVSGANIAVAYEVDAKGRIFAFGDEWVVFANQWLPQGNPPSQQMDQYNPCWQPGDGTTAGFFQSVQTLYQTKQFWYDAINWVAPPNECNFVVDDPDVIIIPR